MALEPLQQFKSIISKVKNVLILLSQNPDGDDIGAAWAFSLYLEKIGVDSSVAFEESAAAQSRYFFLKTPKNVTSEIREARDFVIIFKTQYNKISEIRSEKNGDEFKIYVTPEKGSIDPRDFSFVPANYKYDLIVTVGVPDKESTGKTYEDNPDLFYEVPLVNIDHHSHNENFGQLNFVNLAASSSSEIIHEILNYIDEASVDEPIANCLLTGIISATDSFQKRNTTPKALQISAALMAKGADQQQIVRYLYKTQTFQFLKLWGKVMARLKWDDQLKMVWSAVDPEDLVSSRGKIGDLPMILEKIRSNYSEGEIFCILFPDSFSSTKILLKSSSISIDKIRQIASDATIKGELVEFSIEAENLSEAESKLIQKISAIGRK